MRIGILTSGGDCPGLNAVIRGIAKACYNTIPELEIVGIPDGYGGLISGEFRLMKRADFTGILNIGGTILGTSRQPFKRMLDVVDSEDGTTRLGQMVENYRRLNLDCLLTLGGAGTHKTAELLSREGVNVIGMPKTIDNDLWGTDVTFGFHSAVDIATECIDRLHTTAASHGRTMIVEIMGNKVGWLTLFSGLAGGADIILLPEIPVNFDSVAQAIERRAQRGSAFSIIAIAEGAMDDVEATLKKKEREARRAERGETTMSNRLAHELATRVGVETRVVVPGHIQRGGSPSAYDRLLSTQFGAAAARLIREGNFGTTVAIVGGQISVNRLGDIAGRTKYVPADHQAIATARAIGVSFGD